jgi:hypothetical protein
MTSVKPTWKGLKAVRANFVGNVKVDNCVELVEDMLEAFKAITLEIHFLHSHLQLLLSNLGAVSDDQEQGSIKIYLTWKVEFKCAG